MEARRPRSSQPPQGGWYWNSNRLARAWLPLIGPEGLGLLDYLLASVTTAAHHPDAGWAAVTLDHICHATGWGRARALRLLRLLEAAGLLRTRQAPVAGRGPAVSRSLYQVQREAGPPTAATLQRLGELAAGDPVLSGRLTRYQQAKRRRTTSSTTEPVPVSLPAPVPVSPGELVPVSPGNPLEDSVKTNGIPLTPLSDLPTTPAATLAAAIAEAGLADNPHLHGAELAGADGDGALVITTRAPTPPAAARRITPRLERALTRLLGRPVACHLHYQPDRSPL